MLEGCLFLNPEMPETGFVFVRSGLYAPSEEKNGPYDCRLLSVVSRAVSSRRSTGSAPHGAPAAGWGCAPLTSRESSWGTGGSPPDLRVGAIASDSDAARGLRIRQALWFAVAEESLLEGHDSVYIPRGGLCSITLGVLEL